jgi:hypothetical protein
VTATSLLWKRTRTLIAWLSLALATSVAAGGSTGCVVESDDKDEDATGGKRQRPSEGDAGDVGSGATAGDAGQSEAGASSGGSDDGEAGSAGESTGGRSSAGGSGGTSGGGPSGEAGDTSSAGAPSSGGSASGVAGAEPGTWTYLVYMLADNDLEPFGLLDVEEMMEVGSGGKLTILAQIDRAVGESDAALSGLGEFSSTKRVRVDEGALVELADLGEVNMGSADAVSEFLSWGIEQAPAEHYAVIFWDHGAAWEQYGLDFDNGRDGLTMAELSAGIDAGSKAGALLGPLDVVGFDACLMGSWEVAVALQNRARYLLGSEELEPGHGWDHRSVEVLKDGGDVLELGEAILEGYRDQAVAEQTYATITLSLTDLEKVPAVTSAIGKLATKLTNDLPSHVTAIAQSRAKSPTFGRAPVGDATPMTDLTIWANELSALDSSVRSDVQALTAAVNAAVVEKVAGNAYPTAGGLSLYFPQYRSGYQQSYTALAGVAAWRDLLEDYYDAAAETAGSGGPVFVNTDKIANVTDAGDELVVEGQLEQGTFGALAEATLSFGIVGDDNTAFFLGEQPAEVSATGLVTGVWDKSVLRVRQGDDWDFCFGALQPTSEDTIALIVPLVYTEGAQQTAVVWMIVFDQDANIIANGFYTADDAFAELVVAPGSTFSTLVPTLESGATEAEWVPQLVEFDATDSVLIEPYALDPGTTVRVMLEAIDVAEQSDLVMAQGDL